MKISNLTGAGTINFFYDTTLKLTLRSHKRNKTEKENNTERKNNKIPAFILMYLPLFYFYLLLTFVLIKKKILTTVKKKR